VAGAADRILRCLERFGFEWDGPVRRQSADLTAYGDALAQLRRAGRLFDCSCSRRALGESARYPGTCRRGPTRTGLATGKRLQIDPGTILFDDRLQGPCAEDVADHSGDLLLQRRDGIYAYLLAVVVDDAAQGVTHVVRGADLLPDTAKQIAVQRALHLPTPSYLHVPVLTEPTGAKLAKSRRSIPVNTARPLQQLIQVLDLLGYPSTGSIRTLSLAEAWRWAIEHWDLARVPRRFHLPAR
jgi:glutamyl-Q tRNA(Asp) synthetase